MASKKSAALSYFTGPGDTRWYKNEVEQMKRIHKCYRDSMRDPPSSSSSSSGVASMSESGMLSLSPTTSSSFSPENSIHKTEEVTPSPSSPSSSSVALAKDPNKKVDPEGFLPLDSCLRSVDGEMIAPKNCPCKDFPAFVNTCSFNDFWRPKFDEGGQHDQTLTAFAQSLVSHICESQARKELRVKHGSYPLGRFFRPKREHITPLALTLHELKEWAVNRLRTAPVTDKNTYIDIEKRIRYLNMLQKQEVWGPETGVFEQGMRPIAHDTLFRLLLAATKDLTKARDYAFRGYSRQKSREKLAKLGEYLKTILFNSMRVASCALTLDQKLNDPKAFRLQPTDLLNDIEFQSYVDYSNLANICLHALVKIPLVRGSLLSEFDTAVKKMTEKPVSSSTTSSNESFIAPQGSINSNNNNEDLQTQLTKWKERNLFCVPGGGTGQGPRFLEDDEFPGMGMPKIYQNVAEELELKLRLVDKKSRLPPKRKALIAILTKLYNTPENASKVLRALMKYLAAIEDLVPSSLAVHEFWSLSGDGGDFTVYDTLRSQIIGVMGDTMNRIQAVQSAEHDLLTTIGDLATEHGEAMIQRRLKTRRAEYEPEWITNFNWIVTELRPLSQRGYQNAISQASEVARDAWTYRLTTNELNDRVARCRGTAEAILGSSGSRAIGNQALQGEFNLSTILSVGSNNGWLGTSGLESGLRPQYYDYSQPEEQSSTSSDTMASSSPPPRSQSTNPFANSSSSPSSPYGNSNPFADLEDNNKKNPFG